MMSIFEKYNSLIKQKDAIKKINNILKLSYFFIKIKQNQKKSITKIASSYLGYMVRQNFKLNYLTIKLLSPVNILSQFLKKKKKIT